MWVNEDLIKRGSILDTNDNVLAYSDFDQNNNQVRIYNHSDSSSIITGYNSKTYGKTGIEKTYNIDLLALSDQNFSNFRKMVVNKDQGNDVTLTLNQDIQDILYQNLKPYKGSAVIMNPKTGEVLAMVSLPSYDASIIDEDWDNLIQNKDAPLVNRATSGSYRPGSVFKIITAAAMLDYGIDPNYEDVGVEKIQGFDIKNIADGVYGFIDLRQAFINSVNTYFANKTVAIGKEKFEKETDKFMINKKYPFDLELSESKIPFDKLNQADLAMTGFGYGKSEITPLHMAMVASSIANEGKMMAPRLVKKVTDSDGKIIKESKEKVLSEVTSKDNATKIKEMMVGVINEGSGTSAYLDYPTIAGKTGTADKENGLLDAWFVGFAPADDPKIAIALVLEDSQLTSSESAAPLSRDIISQIFNNIELD